MTPHAEVYSGSAQNSSSSSHSCRKMVGISRQGDLIAAIAMAAERAQCMSIAHGHAEARFPSRAISSLRSTLQSNDPVAVGLRESARRMVGTRCDAGVQRWTHTALATLPLRGAKPMLMQQPLRDLDQVRSFMSSMGPTAFLDMPWIPIFLIGLFLFHPAIGITALLGTAAIISVTLLTERMT